MERPSPAPRSPGDWGVGRAGTHRPGAPPAVPAAGCPGARMLPPPPGPVLGCPWPPHPSPPRFRAAAVPQGAAAGSGVGVSLLSSLPSFFFLVFQAQIGKRGGPERRPSQLPLAAAPAAPWLLQLPAPPFLPKPFICFGAGPRGSLPAPDPPTVGLCGVLCPKPLPKRGARGRAALGPCFLSHLRAGWCWWGQGQGSQLHP